MPISRKIPPSPKLYRNTPTTTPTKASNACHRFLFFWSDPIVAIFRRVHRDVQLRRVEGDFPDEEVQATSEVNIALSNDPHAYDESMNSYLMDFVATMGDIFTAILDFVQDAPRLPVNEYPRDFVQFVIDHNRSNVNPWSAYPEMTVIDIQSARSIR